MAYSTTFLARGTRGSLPLVTMSGPPWTIFSTSRRIFLTSTSRLFRVVAAVPLPSLTRPSRMCSVPMYSWLNRWASMLASCITLRARSVKRSYMAIEIDSISLLREQVLIFRIGVFPRNAGAGQVFGDHLKVHVRRHVHGDQARRQALVT